MSEHGLSLRLPRQTLRPALPQAAFPYVVRVESTVTESNGSSSMASVCGGTLAMLDAGERGCDRIAQCEVAWQKSLLALRGAVTCGAAPDRVSRSSTTYNHSLHIMLLFTTLHPGIA